MWGWMLVILNKRSLRSDEPVPSLPRESGRAARRGAFAPIIARLARFLIMHHYRSAQTFYNTNGLVAPSPGGPQCCESP
jgi:hypothetical protein